MQKLATAFCLIFIAGSAIAESYPSKRPITPAAIEIIGRTRVVVPENNWGIEKTWQARDSTLFGIPFGIPGVLATPVVNAGINAGPAKRAQQAAMEISRVVTAEALNESFIQHVRALAEEMQTEAKRIVFGEVSGVQKYLAHGTC